MRPWLKMAMIGVLVTGTLGACTSRYYDRGYDGGYYSDRGDYRYRDRDYTSRYYDREHRNWHRRHDPDRRWVCDADGDDCHWER